MENDDLPMHLAQFIPKSLDAIVRKNRHLCRLRLATAEDFSRVEKRIPRKQPRHTLVRWQVIVLDVTTQPPVRSLRLVGTTLESGESWITSNVIGIDLRTRMVQTENSLYAIKGRRVLEKNLNFPYICAVLNHWGIGHFLGAPEFFF